MLTTAFEVLGSQDRRANSFGEPELLLLFQTKYLCACVLNRHEKNLRGAFPRGKSGWAALVGHAFPFFFPCSLSLLLWSPSHKLMHLRYVPPFLLCLRLCPRKKNKKSREASPHLRSCPIQQQCRCLDHIIRLSNDKIDLAADQEVFAGQYTDIQPCHRKWMRRASDGKPTYLNWTTEFEEKPRDELAVKGKGGEGHRAR